MIKYILKSLTNHHKRLNTLVEIKGEIEHLTALYNNSPYDNYYEYLSRNIVELKIKFNKTKPWYIRKMPI